MSSHEGHTHNSPPPAKKLRFITNQGAPHPKRRRINAACLTCRKRKIACSGEHPVCNTCKQNKLDCAGYNKSDSGGDTSQSNAASKTSTLSEKQTAHRPRQPSVNLTSKTVGTEPSPGEESNGPASSSYTPMSSTLFSVPRNRMPYFRWLGPTAIMPGFKQMVVKVHRQNTGATSTTDDSGMSPNLHHLGLSGITNKVSPAYSTTPVPIESDVRTPLTLPTYDTSPMPPSELITHLCDTFFEHLGCNFAFLQRERFLKDLEAKQVDAILVDAVCALAARFSTHTLLVEQTGDNGKLGPCEYGQVFAKRAKTALIDTYAVPSVASVQAALLLAYNEFGESRDSGLWIYLGISIRMAQDLGMHTLEGLKYEGRDGPTPRSVKKGEEKLERKQPPSQSPPDPGTTNEESEMRAAERERIDTFWSVFFLDRVVSSGVGRRSTLRDNEIQLSFPALETTDDPDHHPSPFPALIRIVHLYGRVADLLNSIKTPSDVTPGTGKRLAEMETQVTDFYQALSPKLHFEAMNFHHYVNSGDGTTFVLLHFWFHTLIIMLHQPTLLKTFEGKMLQLFPNSQQLSMSSAKTIADILSYSQLIDAKASLGNPFTTQPIYIAACAFLKETAERTATSTDGSRAPSRDVSACATPTKDNDSDRSTVSSPIILMPKEKTSPQLTKAIMDKTKHDKMMAKHTLLLQRASRDYQLCYQALESLETYWEGTKYILTVLDQKFKGVGDPLLYTVEEGESSMETPAIRPTFASPGWRRKSLWTPANTESQETFKMPRLPRDTAGQHDQDLQRAFGWTVTGNLNSSNTNLSWHYPSNPTPPDSKKPSRSRHERRNSMQIQGQDLNNSQPSDRPSAQLQPPYGSSSQADLSGQTAAPRAQPVFTNSLSDSAVHNLPYMTHGASPMSFNSSSSVIYNNAANINQPGGPLYPATTGTTMFGDIMIESQDVDMSLLGMDMLSWLDPVGPDELGMGIFDPNAGAGGLDGTGR